MISLKEWNSFSSKTRRDILETLGENVEVLSQEYHHNFDYDRIGNILKQILECCYKQPNNTIKVCATITPIYASKIEASKSTAKKQEASKTKTYICCYEEEIHDKNGNVVDHDTFMEWCDATDCSEAKRCFENRHPNNVIINIWEE